MPGPKLFISHSAKQDPYACRVRDNLAARLRAKGFEVLLDTGRLDPGDAWRAKLHEWLGVCNGAVILFSRQALDSDWVRKEATILTWRRALNPDLKLVPVLLGDVRSEDTGLGDFRPLQIGEIQFARLASTTQTEADAAQLCERIVAAFEGFGVSDPDPHIQRWAEDIASFLRHADPVHRERARQALAVHDRDWVSLAVQEQLRRLAYQLLITDLYSAEQAIRELRVTLSSEWLKKLVDYVSPIWVSQAAARHILPVTRLDEAQRCLAINAHWLETGDAYIKRATCCADIYLIQANSVAGEDGPAEILHSYELAFREAFGIRPNRPASRIDTNLAQLKQPVFVLVDKDILAPEVLQGLRNRYRKSTLVLLSGDDLPSAGDLGLPALTLIQPPLRPDEEDDADTVIGRLCGLYQSG